MIYPVWWGEEVVYDETYYRKNLPVREPKRHKSADIRRPRPQAYEDTLDRRLRHVHERYPHGVEQPHLIQPDHTVDQSGEHPAPMYTSGASHGFTPMNKSNISPLPARGAASASNTPMTYAGPPTKAERLRNSNGRNDYNKRSFDFGYEDPARGAARQGYYDY